MLIEKQQQEHNMDGGCQNTLVYHFPMLEIGTLFPSLEEAISSIGEIAYNSGCEGMEQLYQNTNFDSRPVVSLVCRLCTANIKFLEVGNNYLLHQNYTRHEHPRDRLSQAQMRYMDLFGFEEVIQENTHTIQQSMIAEPIPEETIQPQESSSYVTPLQTMNNSYQSTYAVHQPIPRKLFLPTI